MSRQAIPITDEFDPERCQGMLRSRGAHVGQCTFKAIPGTQHCHYHRTTGSVGVERRKELNNYRLEKWRERVGELANNDALKNLNEEIGILRITLESILNRCSDASELELNANKIGDLILKIEKLVTSCQRLEQQTGHMLGKSQVITLAGRLSEIVEKVISENVKDQDLAITIIQAIATQVIDLISSIADLSNDVEQG